MGEEEEEETLTQKGKEKDRVRRHGEEKWGYACPKVFSDHLPENASIKCLVN